MNSSKSSTLSTSFSKSTLAEIGSCFKGSGGLLAGGADGLEPMLPRWEGRLVGEEGGLEIMLARWDSAFLRNPSTASIAADVGALSSDAKSKLSSRLTRVAILLFIIDTVTNRGSQAPGQGLPGMLAIQHISGLWLKIKDGKKLNCDNGQYR